MTNNDVYEWSDTIKRVLTLFGYEGDVTIEETDEPDTFWVYHSAFEFPFIGVFPKTNEVFTVITESHTFFDHNGIKRKAKEGIVFNGYTKDPLYYSIYREPEYQRIMMTDHTFNKYGMPIPAKHAKGEIIYTNANLSGGTRKEVLKAPCFESKIFNISHIVEALRK